ncbi:hypothetical protein M422DRAFT_140351, partial [Sphaerobolus stellatus SS14]
MWNYHKRRMGPLEPSTMQFSMANNTVVSSRGTWREIVEMGGCRVKQSFEVFNTKGAFYVLLGQPWLDAVCAVQDFDNDTLTLAIKDGTT